MQMSRWIALSILFGSAFGLSQCSPNNAQMGADTGVVDSGRDRESGTNSGLCGLDSDGDTIPDIYESASDVDGDGLASALDLDSDGDGRPDALEANPIGAYECRQAPTDSDSDGKPDAYDTDSDDNGILDARDFTGVGEIPEGGWALHPADTDRNRVPDYVQNDDDGDGILDRLEIGMDPLRPSNVDMDLTPDYHDLDSDGDLISDRLETSVDTDQDGIANFRDTDSDDDDITDRSEAEVPMGGMRRDINEVPFECPTEVNPSELTMVMPDGRPNYLDSDSDNDGLSDREERENNSDVCLADTDRDGQLDVVEAAFCQQNRRMGCTTDGQPSVRATDYYLILPFNGPIVSRELEFGTNIRIADVFFIFDTTGSMSAVQQAVANTIASPGIGLVDTIRRIIPDAWFGVGHYDDFPTAGYGGRTDRAIHPLCTTIAGAGFLPAECTGAGPNGRVGQHGIVMTNPMARVGINTGAELVQAVARSIPNGGGSDEPESEVEALYQLVTNEGLYDPAMGCGGAIGSAPCWVKPTQCPEGSSGYPCFRNGSLAVAIHYTDVPWHNGARELNNPLPNNYYSPYRGISPEPHNFDQMLAAYQRRSARQININGAITRGIRCEGRVVTSHMQAMAGPCYDMRLAAEGTNSVDVDGAPLVFDMPAAGAAGRTEELVAVVAGAVNTLATRVPLDITTATRNDPANPGNPMPLDARAFIKRRVPSCRVMPENNNCWTAADGVEMRTAVARTDLSTFYRVLPGTRVRFTIFFRNDVYEGDCRASTLLHAYIDVLGDGVTRLDTREVFIVVPAAPANSERCGGAG